MKYLLIAFLFVGCYKEQCHCSLEDKTGGDPLAVVPAGFNMECAFRNQWDMGYGIDLSDLCWGENDRYKIVCDECQ